MATGGPGSIDDALTSFVGGDAGRSVVVDVVRGDGGSWRRNADVERPAASLVKVGIVLAVDAAVREGALDGAASVARDDIPTTVYPSVLAVFDANHRFTYRELGAVMLATSDNPAAEVLLAAVGFDRVNAVLAEAGCRRTRLAVGFGDDHLGVRGRANVTTADDMATLFRHLHRDEGAGHVLDAMRNSMRNFRIPVYLPDEVPVAHKTGSLAGVVHDVGIVYGRDHDVVIAALTDGQPSSAATSLEIGRLALEVWTALGEPV